MELGGISVCRVSIADDEPLGRRAVRLSIEDAGLTPIEESGPLNSLDYFVRKVRSQADAAICDYKLRVVGRYANFTGAEAVARLYKNCFPAMLYTAYAKSDIDDMRQYLRYIPSLLRPDEVDSDTIKRGLEACALEIQGHFAQTRKPWRTLIRVEEYDASRKMARVVMPGWDPNEVVRVPSIVLRRKLHPGLRFHAYVNVGAEAQEKLYITSHV